MKKILYSAASLLLFAGIAVSCSGNSATNADKEREDSARNADSLAAIEASLKQIEEARVDSLQQDSIASSQKDEAENASDPKYDKMLDQYKALIDKCWKLSKQGLSINDQELADVWMEAGSVGNKINKAKKNLSPEQQSRLKDLDKNFTKFCETQPS